MVNNYLDMILAALCGALLGVFFFAGLWWTVRQLASSKHVALLFLASFMLRAAVVVLGFYFILSHSWQSLLSGLIGFVIVRFLATRYVGLKKALPSPEQKSHYAP